MNEEQPPAEGFAGAFGGGGRQQAPPATPVTTQDNLRSRDTVEVMLALCHGPIKGLVNGPRSFFIGDTPVLNADGSTNFTNTYVDLYPGNTPGEVIRPVLGGYEDWRGVHQALAYNVPVSVVTQSPEADQIILRFQVDRLFRRGVLAAGGFSADGALPHRFNVHVRWRPAAGGAWTEPWGAFGTSIVGKTFETEIHELRFPVTPGAGPFVVEVTNLTPNAVDAPCEVRWEGYYDVISGQYGLTRSSTVNVTLSPGVSVTRTTDAPPRRKDGSVGIDVIDIRLLVQQLVENRPPEGNDPGGTFEDQVQLVIEAKRSSTGTWSNPFDGPVTVRGKTTSPVVFEYRFTVPAVDDTYDIRITRISGDEPNRSRVILWESFQEIVGGPARFDGVAVVRVVGRASNQFSSLPDFSGIYDLKLVKVPTNYNPVTREYSGVWDGTFKTEWTDNPAWCLYDLAMNDVYGARRFWPDFTLDRFDVYEAARWCDEMVPNGRGGWQPRYTFNGVISEGRGIKEQLRYMAGVFNGYFVDDLNGKVRLIVDRDQEAVAVFAPENVDAAGFEYTYTETATRYNDVTISFQNPALNYEPDRRRVFSALDQSLNGVVPTEVVAIGCTDPHEAVRRAAYKLITATTECELVSFRTNRRGLFVRPGDVILVADPDMGYALSGRIKDISGGRRVVSLRDPIYLEAGVLYEMRVEVPGPDGFTLARIPLYGSYSGYVLAFETVEPLPEAVRVLAPFSIGAAGSLAGTPKPYRVVSLEEVDGDPDRIAITALEINRNKWLLADSAIDRNGVDFVNMPGEVAPPFNIRVVSEVASVNGVLRSLVIVTWTPSPDPRVVAYQVQYRPTGTLDWINGPTVPGSRADVYDLPGGTYDWRVVALTLNGAQSSWVQVSGVASGLNVPPSNVSELNIALFGDRLTLSWPAVPDRHLSHYRLRYSPIVGSFAAWNVATDLVEHTTSTLVTVPAITGTYFVKAVSVYGSESPVAAQASTAATGLGVNLVAVKAEHPEWTGIREGFFLDNSLLKVNLGYNGVPAYTFETEDLGGIYTSRLYLQMVASAEVYGFEMGTWERLSDVENLSGVSPGDYNFHVFVQAWDGAEWSEWRPFMTGDYRGRRFRFRIEAIPIRPGVVPVLMQVTSIVDMPDRIESGRNLVVPSAGLWINFARPFKAVPTLGITGKNAQTGDRFIVWDESRFGFSVRWFNAAGSPITRTIDWIAVGLGYGEP